MKKANKQRQIRLQKKRERKRLKRIRNNKTFQGFSSTFSKDQKFREKVDLKIIEKFQSPLNEFFKEKGLVTGKENTSATVTIPADFSFSNEFKEAVDTIRHFIAAVFFNIGKEITLDFSNCKSVDQTALFVLQIIRMEFQEDFQKLDNKLSLFSGALKVNVNHSNIEKVNKLLLVTGLIPKAELKIDGLMPVTTTGYYKGVKSQKHYAENKKGIIGTRIVAYLNECLARHGYIFNTDGTNYLDGLISEILNNAEDHSPMNTYYVTANMLGELHSNTGNNGVVGELNLSIMNFGDSYYEGFEKTKTENEFVYNQMEQLCAQTNISWLKAPFTKENLFTLYALQDGMSRLKYEDESRGTGTMKFINSFFAFGDYEDAAKKYHPMLNLVTGNTYLLCDNKYKPFEIDGVHFLSLNDENDLSILPNKTHLKSTSRYFPGTLLTAKIYLNNHHLNEKINKTNNGNKTN